MSSTEAKNHGNHSKSLIFSLHTMIREVLKGNRENISRLENPLVPLAPIEPRIWHGVWSTLRRNASSNSVICSRINSVSIPKTHLESTMENQSHWTLKSKYFGQTLNRAGRFSPFPKRRETTVRKNWVLSIEISFQSLLGGVSTWIEVNEVRGDIWDR